MQWLHTQPGGGAVGQSTPELWHVLGWRMRPPVQEEGGVGLAQHSSIALRAGVPMTVGRRHRKEVIFFQRQELSVREEGMVVAEEVWAETGTSTWHLHVFTTWSHHWLIMETVPAWEFRISYRNNSLGLCWFYETRSLARN